MGRARSLPLLLPKCLSIFHLKLYTYAWPTDHTNTLLPVAKLGPEFETMSVINVGIEPWWMVLANVQSRRDGPHMFQVLFLSQDWSMPSTSPKMICEGAAGLTKCNVCFKLSLFTFQGDRSRQRRERAWCGKNQICLFDFGSFLEHHGFDEFVVWQLRLLAFIWKPINLMKHASPQISTPTKRRPISAEIIFLFL